ncbi:hypothetical protein A2954_03915 [Candidatus Roizmanbacteria bacterium RIFCSPLOWO2_01_FULL_37_12]|uniref:Glutamine--fructose-6-phosphate aminotransferase [isomerizing] n=1 Tax=Candidatus Roizmanbacteria bacterium RIFCSPLOWO2_01_FULL_37_12 TaxID=1802056 RepID=A0A1F7IEQ3_9BACT|nr:MAG: hypothetical protein A3D76_02680 [Candidatus Roizmanbacteria bacterium RIFCSPHIGHO2_02_FULL_37_9b]OGK41831.1 MAG: hypothetical protein A2954_03915 [Candidatus Roizmanbacteria bacterium RIFCSPLOWO2_01_FULL_37_12]
MCGIFAVVNDKTNQAAQTTLEGLKKLEYRGYDSWGIALIPNNKKTIKVDKHIGKIGQAKTYLPTGSIAIGHTRWATHGGVTDKNAHPHLDCKKEIAVIHNGIVENYKELKSQLNKKGHTFRSDTDTEVIAHIIEEKIKTRSINEAVFSTFNSLAGSNAIVVLDRKTGTVIACRNGSPLVVGLGDGQFFLGSDVPAFLKYTNRVHFLNDGEGVTIRNNGIKINNLKSGKTITFSSQVLDWKLEDAEKGGYPHFLLKEIYDQKITIEKTASLNADGFAKISQMLNQNYKIVLTGCGSASYCALAGKYFFAAAGIDTQVYAANELMPFINLLGKKTLLIAISQSGETADTIIAVKAAKKNGATIVAVVNAKGSTLERLSDIVLSVGAGPEIAVVSTKAFTSQLATLYLLSKSAVGKLEHGKMNIKKLSHDLKNLLSPTLIKRLIKIATSLLDQEHIFIIGKHLNYPAGLEFAMKIKETSYLHAESFAAGELKHGVITLIQKGTPCFVLASTDDAKDEVLSSAAQLKARGGRIIGVAPFNSREFDEVIKTPDLGDLTIFPNIIVGQLLGYYLGIGRGADPDKPRNLAKSVTVK